MLDQQKISVGRVRQAYALTANEVERLIQALWPDAVFPVELWYRTHKTFWRPFTDSNQTVYKLQLIRQQKRRVDSPPFLLQILQ